MESNEGASPAAFRTELNAGPEQLIAVTVTSLQKYKGLENLLAAAAKVVEQDDTILFAIAGTCAGTGRRVLQRRLVHPRQPHIARRTTPHGSGLGKVRWVVERTISWIKGLRRLRVRYDRLGVIQEATVAIRGVLQFFEEVRQQADVVAVELGELRDFRGTFLVMRAQKRIIIRLQRRSMCLPTKIMP